MVLQWFTAAHQPPGPFFVFFIPIFFIFQGAKVTDTSVVGFGVYYVAISLFCEFLPSSSASRLDCRTLRVHSLGFSTMEEPGKLLVRTSEARLGG